MRWVLSLRGLKNDDHFLGKFYLSCGLNMWLHSFNNASLEIKFHLRNVAMAHMKPLDVGSDRSFCRRMDSHRGNIKRTKLGIPCMFYALGIGT